MHSSETDATFRALRQRARQHDAADVAFAEPEHSLRCPSVLAEDGSPLFVVEAAIELAATPRPASWSLRLDDPAGPTLLRLVGDAMPGAEDDAGLRARFEALLPTVLSTSRRLWQLKPRWVERDGELLGSAAQWLLPPASWQGDRQYITDHMNEDHVEQMRAMCRHFFGLMPQQVALIALDSEGMHLRADGHVHYLPFARCCDSTREVAMETVRLSIEAGAGSDHGLAAG